MLGSFLSLALAGAAAPPLPAAEEIVAPGPQAPLHGTYQPAPGSGAPVVLIVPGSGPTDRDGDSPLGMKAATYRLLAVALAERGVASVRIDKRGMFASAAAVPDANAVTMDAYADDVAAWIGAIRQRTGASCVWLGGHSEGGLVALVAAARPGLPICGVVLLATAGRPLGALIRAQLGAEAATAPLLPAAELVIAALEAGKRVEPAAIPAPLMGLFAPQVQGFLISEMALDPARLAAGIAVPMLIVQGESDLQVGMEDARRLAAAAPAARLAAFPGVNHVLKQVPAGDRMANLAAYANPDLPLAPGLADRIAAFVKSAPGH